MADHVTVGGINYATDDLVLLNGVVLTLGTAQAQRIKIGYGDDGVYRDASFGFPFPVMSPDDVATGTITATDAVVPAPSGTGVLVTGTPTAGSFVAMALPGGESAWVVQLTGTFGGGTVHFGCSADSTNGVNGNWSTLSLRTMGTNTSVNQDGATASGLFRGNASGMSYVRVRITGATAPSVAVVLRAAEGDGPTALNAPIPAGTNRIGEVTQRAADQAATVTAAAGAAATLTLPAPAAGLFHHLTGIYLHLYSTAARTGVAAPILVTTTNLPGGRAFVFGTAAAIGTVDRLPEDFALPIKVLAAATATTFSAPIVAGGLWRMTATFYTAP